MHPSFPFIVFTFIVVIIDLYHLGIRDFELPVYCKTGDKILIQKLTVFVLIHAAFRLINCMLMLFQ
jgi:hypothetical protein